MMRYQRKIYLYDWEMAGTYPLGYDLFTFLFQTAFLVQPKKTVQHIIVDNQVLIDQYFGFFDISDWKEYLAEFSRVKISFEKIKGTKGLLHYYQGLRNYAEKT